MFAGLNTTTATTETSSTTSVEATPPPPPPKPPPPPPEDDLSAEDRAQLEMMKAMGLPCGFDTTAGKAVHQSNEGTVNIKKKRTYRQYMNRRGGFNKPLQNVPG